MDKLLAILEEWITLVAYLFLALLGTIATVWAVCYIYLMFVG